MKNTIDIRYKGENLQKRLSNLYPYEFTFEGIHYGSIESFFGTLRTSSLLAKQKIYNLSGMDSWYEGHKYMTWYNTQTVDYKGKTINRHSVEYDNLITSVYDALFTNEDFKKALLETDRCKLSHKIGKTDKHKTLLTQKEFIGHLNRLRDKLYERKYFNLLDLFENLEQLQSNLLQKQKSLQLSY